MPNVDINLASADELDAVEGLRGHDYEIVRYRAEHGRFTDTRRLDEVPRVPTARAAHHGYRQLFRMLGA